jgi:hypothetical protein
MPSSKMAYVHVQSEQNVLHGAVTIGLYAVARCPPHAQAAPRCARRQGGAR